MAMMEQKMAEWEMEILTDNSKDPGKEAMEISRGKVRDRGNHKDKVMDKEVVRDKEMEMDKTVKGKVRELDNHKAKGRDSSKDRGRMEDSRDKDRETIKAMEIIKMDKASSKADNKEEAKDKIKGRDNHRGKAKEIISKDKTKASKIRGKVRGKTRIREMEITRIIMGIKTKIQISCKQEL